MGGTISEEDIQKVREASDIVALIGERTPLKQRGRDFWCCCPLHNEKTPSFKIDPASQLWHCFGCGEGGDIFAYLMKTEDYTFPEAVRYLAERAHIEISESSKKQGFSSSYKARLKEVCRASADFYHTQLMRSKNADAASARKYLAGRDLGGDIPKRWQLGFAPGRGALVRHLSSLGFKPKEMIDANVVLDRAGKLNDRFYTRIMFPIRDVGGDVIAFGGRVIGKGEPKYLNSQETPLFHKSQVLFGLDMAKSAMASNGEAIVVEGYTDVIALHEAGVKNVVATLGTALTRQHIRILSRHAKNRIVYLFDGDAAGQRAADRALGFIDFSMTPEAGARQIELCAVTLPDNLDPAEFIAAHGKDELRSCIAGAVPLLQYGISRRLASHNLSTAEGRAAALSDALSVLAPIKDSLLAKDYAVQIAGQVHAREQDVLDALSHLKLPTPVSEAYESAPAQNRTPQSSSYLNARQSASQVSASQQQTSLSSAQQTLPQASQQYSQRQTTEQLSQSELNRRKFEREFLSLLAKHPECATPYMGSLIQTQWHDELCGQIALLMVSIFESNMQISPAAIVSKVAQNCPQAAGMLTSDTMSDVLNPQELGDFLVEELSLGDAEEAIAQLRRQMAQMDENSPDYKLSFEVAAGMQKELACRRAAHKPPFTLSS